jgi:RNA polymerase sigma-70 factor (ECF subfamily)
VNWVIIRRLREKGAGLEARDPSSAKHGLDARFRLALMAYFLRRTGSYSEAEDLTQETFARLIGSAGFERADEPQAYVFRVASNLLHDRGRAAARMGKYTACPPQMLDETSLNVPEDFEPERVLIGRESLSEVLSCLDELGQRTKSIFIMFRLEGMKQKDIAALYGMGQSTVEKQVMLAVMHLAKRFGPSSP